MSIQWYAAPKDDGYWCVTANKKYTEHPLYVIANCTTEYDAERIARLLNEDDDEDAT